MSSLIATGWPEDKDKSTKACCSYPNAPDTNVAEPERAAHAEGWQLGAVIKSHNSAGAIEPLSRSDSVEDNGRFAGSGAGYKHFDSLGPEDCSSK